MILEKIIIGIAIFVSYFLQTSVDFFRLGSIKPDFLLILTVYFALYRGSFSGLWVGFLGGILQDINLGWVSEAGKATVQYYLGTQALPKTVLGYFTGKISKNINKEGSVVIFALMLILTFIKGLITFFVVAIFHSNVEAQAVITIVLPEALYTGVLSIIWFKLLKWAIPPVTQNESRYGF